MAIAQAFLPQLVERAKTLSGKKFDALKRK